MDDQTIRHEIADGEDILAALEEQSRAFNAKVAALKPEWVTPAGTATAVEPEVVDELAPGHFGPDGPEKDEVAFFPTTCLADVTISPVDWLWEGRIPRGMITLVEGDPGVGKSTLVADIVARHTSGTPFPGSKLARTPERALWLTLEDSLEHTLKPRIVAASGDPKRIDAMLGVPILATSGNPHAGNISALRETIRRTGATLLVMDPGAATVEDANSEAIVRQAMGELFRIGQEMGVTVIWIRHLVKNREGKSALMAGGGSIGLAAAARSVLQVVVDRARKDKGMGLDRCVIQPKNNLGAEAAPFYFGLEDTRIEENFAVVNVARALWAYEPEHGVDHYDILESISSYKRPDGAGPSSGGWEDTLYAAFEQHGWALTTAQVEAALSAGGAKAKKIQDLGARGREWKRAHGITWDSAEGLHRMTRPTAE